MDAILYWNNIALDAVAISHTGDRGEQRGPTRTARALAIAHLAMYDAYTSIAKGLTPYLSNISLDINGSVRTKHIRRFQKLSDAIAENGKSRIYLGVHWQFDADGGIASGTKIADFIFNKFLKPVS